MSIEDVKHQYEVGKAELSKKLQTAIKEEFTKFFIANPEVDSISWSQYTPYFNDGDECVFRVNHFQFFDKESEEIRYPRWGEEENSLREFNALMRSIDDEIFKEMFGNHCEVTATREEFTVEEYEHD